MPTLLSAYEGIFKIAHTQIPLVISIAMDSTVWLLVMRWPFLSYSRNWIQIHWESIKFCSLLWKKTSLNLGGLKMSFLRYRVLSTITYNLFLQCVGKIAKSMHALISDPAGTPGVGDTGWSKQWRTSRAEQHDGECSWPQVTTPHAEKTIQTQCGKESLFLLFSW